MGLNGNPKPAYFVSLTGQLLDLNRAHSHNIDRFGILYCSAGGLVVFGLSVI